MEKVLETFENMCGSEWLGERSNVAINYCMVHTNITAHLKKLNDNWKDFMILKSLNGI